MKATINDSQCIGCELCVSLCPTIFSTDETGSVYVLDVEITEDDELDVMDAIECCPVGAIEEEE